ncbi:TPA: DNA-packaging protein FI [Salmonella enterica subsp. enterica serovar Muenchen]|nr:DNA breaking-rejoining protein [Salmonella enterica]
MATKEENIARLQELAVQLGREADISGSAAEIRQRVAEWEEELGGGSMPDGKDAETTADATEAQDEPGSKKSEQSEQSEKPVKSSTHSSEFALIRAVRTLHIHALAVDSDRVLDTVPAGDSARVPAIYVDELVGDGLIVAL